MSVMFTATIQQIITATQQAMDKTFTNDSKEKKLQSNLY